MLELLNQLLAEYIYEDTVGADFWFLTTFSEIILRQKTFLREQKYRTRMGLNKSYQLSYEFLTRLSPMYGEYLEAFRESGRLLVHTPIERYPEELSSMIVSEEGKKIDIYPIGTVEDTYTFSHEIMHSWNCDENNMTSTWNLLTECISILIESLQQDDFERIKECPPEYRKNKRDTYYALRQKALRLRFEIQLLETFQTNGYIDANLLISLLQGKNGEEKSIALEHLDWIEEEQQLEIWDLQRYVISGVLASHMHQRIVRRPSLVQEFITLNDYLNEMDFLDVLAYLDLEVLDDWTLELSKESCKVLEKNYKAELHSL